MECVSERERPCKGHTTIVLYIYECGDGYTAKYYLIRTGLETCRDDCDRRWFSNLILPDGSCARRVRFSRDWLSVLIHYLFTSAARPTQPGVYEE